MDKPDSQNLRQSLNAIANDVSQLVIREQQVMNDEFLRMAAILQDAARHLHECFGGISNQIAMQSGRSGMNTPLPEQEHIHGDDMNAMLSTAVRALQFEDILQQMINHSRRRVEEIEKLFVVLAMHINELDRNGGETGEKVMDTLNDCLKDIEAVKTSLGLENPVKHTSLDHGEIELF